MAVATHKAIWVFIVAYLLYMVGTDYLLALHNHRSLIFVMEVALVVSSLLLTHFILIRRLLATGKLVLFLSALLLKLLLFALAFCIVHKQVTACNCNIVSCTFGNAAKFVLPNALLIGIYLYGRSRKKDMELQQASKARVELELQLLKSQISPHHLFNCLNTVYSYSLQKNAAVSDMILKLSDNLRYVLYESKDEFVPLQKEMDCISNFIDFQRLRISNTATIDYVTTGNFKSAFIAPMILVPLVENVFKHASGSETNKARIEIEIAYNDNTQLLEFRSLNSFDPEKTTSADGGIGLTNLKKRIQILYGDKTRLSTSIENGYFKYHLSINLGEDATKMYHN